MPTPSTDTIRYRYNAARQIVGVIGPDPDGAGALHHRAIRATYGADGQPTRIERGTVDSQSDNDWASFSTLQEVQAEYDSHHRPVVQRLVSGSTTHALTQTGYDALGRVQCVAQRMNPSEFATASLPSDACTLDAEGSHGPDRIARTTYDDAGRPILVQTGYGVTGVAADEAAATYTANGLVETLTDAEGNRTTYVYDGLDRLSRTRMPHPGTDNTSSIGDYEELTYEMLAGGTRASPLVASRRLRDGNSILYAYDGNILVAEYNGSNTLLRRYVHGPGTDELLVWYEGTDTSDRRWLHQDERGSVVAISNGSASVTNLNAYDENGIPASGNTGRFQYTGQQWIGELGMYHYRARIYSPTLGRFLQTDPIGFRGGMNLYAYVRNDAVNYTDPLGLYPMCRYWRGYTYTDSEGVPVVVASVWECYDVGDASVDDLRVIDYINGLGNIGADEAIFTVLEDRVEKVDPDKKVTCPMADGSVVDSYSANTASFFGGTPGHVHTEGHLPGPGPEDGRTALQGGTGEAFIGTTTGVVRVDRFGPGDYGLSLLHGSWGVSESFIRNMIDNWNQNDGISSSTPISQQNPSQCTTTNY